MPSVKPSSDSTSAYGTSRSQRATAASTPAERTINGVPAYISYIDTDRRYAFMTPTYERTFDRPISEMLGHLVSEVVGSAYAEIGPNLEAAFAGEHRCLEPVVGTPPNERILSVEHIPDCDESGNVRGVIIYGHDITEIRRAESALRKSEERLRLAVSATQSIGFWDWDVVNDLVYAGPTFAKLYGVDPITAEKGMSVDEFTRCIHPEDFVRMTTAVQQALRDGGDLSTEYRLRQPDGSFVWVLAVGRCNLNDEGVPVRFPGVSIDITDRKRRDEALIQSEKLAAVGRLASSIAHEINNPLEAITNLIYLARQNANLPIVQQYLEAADTELRRVSAIANQTLRFHKQSSHPQAIQARELFSTVLALFEGRLKNSDTMIETSYRARRTAICFEGDVRQVLNNLVGNALDAMGVGGHLIIRSHDSVDWPTLRRGLVLTIADNGSGMSPETMSKLFEPFFTTKGIAGTGLGLWVSKEVVDRHHGTIRVRSSQNPAHAGSVFRLFLPYEQ